MTKHTDHILLTEKDANRIREQAALANLTPEQFIANALNLYATIKRMSAPSVYAIDHGSEPPIKEGIRFKRIQVP